MSQGCSERKMSLGNENTVQIAARRDSNSKHLRLLMYTESSEESKEGNTVGAKLNVASYSGFSFSSSAEYEKKTFLSNIFFRKTFVTDVSLLITNMVYRLTYLFYLQFSSFVLIRHLTNALRLRRATIKQPFFSTVYHSLFILISSALIFVD